MSIALLVIAGFIALGALLTINNIGKPRTPITPSLAASTTLLSAVEAVVLVLAALR